MSVTKYFQIINLTVPSTWVALLLSFLITYLIVRVKFGKEAAHLTGDSMFYFLIVWKFSVIVTDFNTIIQFPLSILYFNGGRIGVYLGILAVATNLYWINKKRVIVQSERFSLLVGSILTLSTYQLLMALLNEGTFAVRMITISLFAIFIVSVIIFTKQFQGMLKEFVLLAIGLHLFVSAWQPAGIMQTSTITLIVTSGLLFLTFHKSQREAH